MTVGAWSSGGSCLYFAFGSNMNPERMRARALRFDHFTAGRLADFELVFDKVSSAHPHIAHANIRRAPGQRVEGVLYHLRDHTEIERLDRFERTPINYSRELFPIATDDGVQWAWTYVANPGVRRNGLRPDREYLDHLLAGRRWLSPEYIAALECIDVV